MKWYNVLLVQWFIYQNIKKLEKNTQTLLRFQTLVAFTLEVNCIETEKKEWLAETERGWVIGDVTLEL